MMLRTIITVISISIINVACQHLDSDIASQQPSLPDPSVEPAPAEKEIQQVTPADTELSIAQKRTADEEAIGDLWQRLQSQLVLDNIQQDRVQSAREQWLKYPNFLDNYSEAASPYLHYVLNEVERREMPAEIALLPLVESGYDPFAYSPGKAAGLWQIMPSTGDHLGLNRTWWWDGRRDIRRSTDVALDYLEEMHEDLGGDWLLALAAYNCGKGCVLRAMKKNRENNKKTNYWSLQLPSETTSYVPKLLALSSIVSSPERFDLNLPRLADEPVFTAIPTGGQIELQTVAELAGIDSQSLRDLNPGQLRWATAPTQPQEILVPVAVAPQLEAELAALPANERLSLQRYTIASGDSLSTIARRFGTRVSAIKQVNQMSGDKIRAGKTLLIPTGTSTGDEQATAQATDYRVKSGDSLHRIANKFKVSVADISRWNSLDPGRYLQPGQTLTLFPKSS